MQSSRQYTLCEGQLHTIIPLGDIFRCFVLEKEDITKTQKKKSILIRQTEAKKFGADVDLRLVAVRGAAFAAAATKEVLVL